MTHQDVQQQLVLLVSGELASETRQAVLEHASTCADCKAELQVLRQSYFLLQEAIDALPEQTLTAAELAALTAAEPDATTAEPDELTAAAALPPVAPIRRNWRMLRVSIKLAAGIAIIGLATLMLLPPLGKSRARSRAIAFESAEQHRRAVGNEVAVSEMRESFRGRSSELARQPYGLAPMIEAESSRDSSIADGEATLDFSDTLQIKSRSTRMAVPAGRGGIDASGLAQASPSFPPSPVVPVGTAAEFAAAPAWQPMGSVFHVAEEDVAADAYVLGEITMRGSSQISATSAPAPRTESLDLTKPLPPPPLRPVNPFVLTANNQFSTFALEADTAAYALSRQAIRSGHLPPPASVRIEEFINAFDYNYAPPTERCFAIHATAAPSPFGRDLALLKIGVKGRVLGRDGRKHSHLVLVVDSSGSMGQSDRLPVVKHAMQTLFEQLDERDLVTLISFDVRPRLIFEAVPATARDRLHAGIAALETGASTNLLGGLELGYELAARHFRPGQINRVLLCTDGMVNVGPDNAEQLLARVARYREQGISLTAVGVGAGAYNDQLLNQLAKKGDGNYVFIDSIEQAQQVFATQMSATLQMIARDVRIQVEFNPAAVRRFRLIGYENRAIADADFRKDVGDGGVIGSGQAATALYELELVPQSAAAALPSLGTVYVRYRDIDNDRIEEISSNMPATLVRPRQVETAPRFFLAACIAEFAEILRRSEYVRGSSLEAVETRLQAVAKALPLDKQVADLLRLVRQAQGLPEAP